MPFQVRANLPAHLPLRRRGGREFPANTWVILTDEEMAGPLGAAVRGDACFSVEELDAKGKSKGALEAQGVLAAENAVLKADCARLTAENAALAEADQRHRAALLDLRTRLENAERDRAALASRVEAQEASLSEAAAQQKALGDLEGLKAERDGLRARVKDAEGKAADADKRAAKAEHLLQAAQEAAAKAKGR